MNPETGFKPEMRSLETGYAETELQNPEKEMENMQKLLNLIEQE